MKSITQYMRWFSIVFLFFQIAIVPAQMNLVPNHSFETYTTCPNNFSQIERSGNWIQPSSATTDFYHSCALATATDTVAGVWVPSNASGYQEAYGNGIGYAGFIACEDPAGGVEWKEYVQTQLSTTLTAGQTYYCSFYVSLSNTSYFGTDVISAYFSAIAPTSTTAAHFSVTPQISSPAGVFITDTLNWVQVSGSFTAVGGERYITIGVFKHFVNTATVIVNSSVQWPLCYYFLDEVCISTSPVTCKVFSTNVGIVNYNDEYSAIIWNSVSKTLSFTEKNGLSKVTLFDSWGSQLRTWQISGESKMDLSDLQTGCYFVSVTAEGNTQMKKIIVSP